MENGFLPENIFKHNLGTHFKKGTSRGSDLAVIYRRGKPIHSYIPIGETGWVLTKNGTGGLQPLRFMRESELISYYRTLRDHSCCRDCFSWEEKNEALIGVEYFDLR